MRRLLAILFLLAPLASGQDVMLILADDIGQADIDQLQARGAIPNITALARSGVQFRNAFANPVCSPSRRSFQFSRWYFAESGAGCAAAPTGIEPPLADVSLADLARQAA
jgi:arylsulfatase A-like enzyme